MAQPSKKERRKSRRVPIQMNLTFVYNGQSYEGMTENISTGGFFLRLQTLLPIGAMIPFSLSHADMSEALDVVGKIVHLWTTAESDDIGIGVQIHQYGKNQDERYEAYRKLIKRWIDAQSSPVDKP